VTRPEWKAGDVVAERFRLEAELGRGAMGAVWRATQLNLAREVALKLLLPQYAAWPGARKRFEREARVASALTHPNAVRTYDFGDDGGQLFIAMELLHGRTLRAICGENVPVQPIPRVVDLLAPIADVVLAAHEIQLVHRDLKPENVFLETSQPAERVVVVDFGLAFIPGDPKTGRLTNEGVAMGTPDYMPPEQASGHEVGPAADVYALGCMFYELLTGKTPFRGEHMQIIAQQLFSAPVPPSEARRDLKIPRELEELCLRMLAKLPAERPTMEVVRGVLRHQDESDAQRERARPLSSLEGREARMITTVLPKPGSQTLTDLYAPPPGVDPLQVAVLGELAGDLALGLGANGLLAFIVGETQPIEGAAVIYAPSASPEELAALRAKHGLPIVTNTSPSDLDRVTALLRAGVDEVVHEPARADELARRIWRAVRHHRRQKPK
jgi:serine/threonine protein kinase